MIVLIVLEMLCEFVDDVNGNNLNVDTSNGIGFVNWLLKWILWESLQPKVQLDRTLESFDLESHDELSA